MLAERGKPQRQITTWSTINYGPQHCDWSALCCVTLFETVKSLYGRRKEWRPRGAKGHAGELHSEKSLEVCGVRIAGRAKLRFVLLLAAAVESVRVKQSLFTPWRHSGGVEVQLHSFLTSASSGGDYSSSCTYRSALGPYGAHQMWMWVNHAAAYTYLLILSSPRFSPLLRWKVGSAPRQPQPVLYSPWGSWRLSILPNLAVRRLRRTVWPLWGGRPYITDDVWRHIPVSISVRPKPPPPGPPFWFNKKKTWGHCILGEISEFRPCVA